MPNALGVHGGGHFIISGDPGGDAFISPGDPAFYAHHAQIDRIYWIWQMLDFDNRQVRVECATPPCVRRMLLITDDLFAFNRACLAPTRCWTTRPAQTPPSTTTSGCRLWVSLPRSSI